jgi:hypothetical protein
MMEETKGWFTSWTMKSDHGRWHVPMVRLHDPTSMVRCLKKSIYNAFGPLTLGFNQMWTKRDGHAPKNECVDFLDICPKKVCFILRKKTK